MSGEPEFGNQPAGPGERTGRGPLGRLWSARRQLRGIAWIGWLGAAAGATRKRPHQPHSILARLPQRRRRNGGTHARLAWFFFFFFFFSQHHSGYDRAGGSRLTAARRQGQYVRLRGAQHTPAGTQVSGAARGRALRVPRPQPRTLFLSRACCGCCAIRIQQSRQPAHWQLTGWRPRPEGAPPAHVRSRRGAQGGRGPAAEGGGGPPPPLFGGPHAG